MGAKARLRVVVVGLACLAILASAIVYGAGKKAAYGPCCPLVKGQKQPTAQGPRFTCKAHKPLSLTYKNVTHQVGAVEASGTLLVPARLFVLTGATIQARGHREVVLGRGGRKVDMMVGDHKVRIAGRGEGREIKWNLCPRRRANVTYVPLREAAVALGLSVGWKAGQVTLSEAPGEPTVPTTAQKPASCPAERCENALGAKIVRGQANTAIGRVGVEVTSVTRGGAGARMGLKPADVIIAANGKSVTCPRDLDQAIGTGDGAIHSLTVARGQKKLEL